MRRALPLVLFSVVTCTPRTPPTAPMENVAIRNVPATDLSVTNTNAVVETPSATDGWVGIETAPREKVIDAIRHAPARVLVRVYASIEECSGLGGTHVFFHADDASRSPFRDAHLGGHGVRFDADLPPGALFVAGVRTHASKRLSDPGWCLDGLLADASVIALLPVRDPVEGLRVIETLR